MKSIKIIFSILFSGISLMEYDEWIEENINSILIELAESGADRELCFDPEAEFEKRYELYKKENS